MVLVRALWPERQSSSQAVIKRVVEVGSITGEFRSIKPEVEAGLPIAVVRRY
jgi:hypothetical protein